MAKTEAGKAERHENPLMPDERLRQMYTAMVQMRMLEEHLRRRPGKKKGSGRLDTVRGEEAVRASTALSLGTGDMLSDRSAGPGMDLLLGAKLGDLTGLGGRRAEPASDQAHALRLAPGKDVREQMELAVGAAAALKAQGGGRVLLVYIGAGEAKKKAWRRTLGVAGRLELPVIFVVLPRLGRDEDEDAGEISRRSRGWGVPGFPVDGSDAIALYRVMQESLLRGRAGGGPALLECIEFRVAGAGRHKVEDPVARLEELLVLKGVADVAWMTETKAAFTKRLAGGRR